MIPTSIQGFFNLCMLLFILTQSLSITPNLNILSQKICIVQEWFQQSKEPLLGAALNYTEPLRQEFPPVDMASQPFAHTPKFHYIQKCRLQGLGVVVGNPLGKPRAPRLQNFLSAQSISCSIAFIPNFRLPSMKNVVFMAQGRFQYPQGLPLRAPTAPKV